MFSRSAFGLYENGGGVLAVFLDLAGITEIDCG
jgi:hypothetical protein